MTSTTEALYQIEHSGKAVILRLTSVDGTNRLTRARVIAVAEALEKLATEPPSRLVITGNAHFFSVGADLNEICALTGPEAFRFAQMGQRLMQAVAAFPVPTVAAVHGYCMGGGLDLALACRQRIAGPHALFGHRGAALGLITGWGGTRPANVPSGGKGSRFPGSEDRFGRSDCRRSHRRRPELRSLVRYSHAVSAAVPRPEVGADCRRRAC